MITLGSIAWQTLGLSGVCVVLVLTLVWMIVSGKFVPESQVERMLETERARTADERARNAYLEGALTKRDAAFTTVVQQNAKLTIQADAGLRVLQSLPTEHQSGSDHVATPE
ncbi:hypothetical protein NONO_c17990 [Nocardia nova SH22a]|uniref:Uncharacterized protein n=1 Tax=Nocardia nova SH22a TaxID=1415166 RepID=W5TBQ4_9NOCA|nr:hypothetical protein [Nocardia nova]AHH16599.1 hypothetical protein NONO_c17990 [Nocardia nova SH22a]